MATEQLYILPGGFVDVHGHVRDWEEEEKGTVESETQAALAGGVFTLLGMPNTKPPLDNPRAHAAYRNYASSRTYVKLGVYFKATPESAKYFKEVESTAAAYKYYMEHTTNNADVATEQGARQVFEGMTQVRGKILVVHAEDQLPLALRLRKEYGVRLHIAHIDSAKSVALLEKAVVDSPGMVTAEVTPHHLMLTGYDAHRMGGFGMMKPPLGSPLDREALRTAVKDGLIPIIATDHAPHPRHLKEAFTPESGPYGVTGLETSLKMMLKGIDQGFIHDLDHLFDLMQRNPARIFDLPINPRDKIVIDLNAPFEIRDEDLLTKAKSSPFHGMTGKGVVKEAWLDGQLAYADGEIIDKDKPKGKVLSHFRY